MKQGMLRGAASLGLLLAIASCTELPVVPSRNTSGTPSTGSTTTPGTTPNTGGTQVEPVAPAVSSIVITPNTLEINAPHHTPESEMPDINSPDSDGTDLEHESANYPTTALLTPSFKASSGEATAPAALLWTSSNPQLVTVDEYGWVQANDTEVGGTATITARLRSNPQVFATATVTVRNDGQLAIELK